MGRHYIGDVCAGMPLGILTVAVVTKVTLALTCYMSVPDAVTQPQSVVQGRFTPDSMLLNAQHVQQFYDGISKLWLLSGPMSQAI